MDTKKVFLETMNIIQSGQYISNNGNIVTIDISEMLSNTKLYRTQLKCKSDSLYQTQISICNEDTFNCADHIISMNKKVCVVNFCSERHAGGIVAWSGRAQEESLVCRSTLAKSLYLFARHPNNINIRNLIYYQEDLFDENFGAIFSPDVTVFRNSDYSLKDFPFKVSIISIPALRNPKMDKDHKLQDRESSILRNKIKTILNIAIENNLFNIVLGAIGCGAYNNPPSEIAEIFFDIILKDRYYKNAFEHIYFAILGNENFQIFQQTFRKYDLSML